MAPITIDVVIPLYNKRRYVRSALDSVLKQSLLPTRIIVVDDGSTDGGGSFVSSFFPTVELIHQENQGVGFARNTGLSSASSAWVAFLDADDVWLPNHLSEISTLCNEFPSAGLVGTSHIQAANVADLDPIVDLATERHIVNYFKEAAQDIGIIWTSATAVHRESALTVGGFGTAPLGQDLEFWARMALKWAVAYSTARTAVHRRATGGAMDSAQFPASVASHVRHISPAAETVYSALMDGNCWVEHADLLDYLDSRVAAAMMMRLARTDVKGARQLRRLAHRPWHRPVLLPSMMTLVPTPALRVSILVRRAVRRARSRIRGSSTLV